MANYKIARLDEIEELSDGRAPWRPVRHELGLLAFGANAFVGKQAGDRLINEHDEADDKQEELYAVMSGRARFEIAGESVDAPQGTFLAVPPGVMRTAFAEEDGTTLLAIGGVPGEVYVPHGYEIWSQLAPLHQAGDYAAVVEQGRPVIEANPQYPMLFYNLACCEALVGETDEAIEHLRHAVAGFDQFREYAQGDSDFDVLRDDPRFKELVGD